MVILACLKVLSQHLSGETGKPQRIFQPENREVTGGCSNFMLRIFKFVLKGRDNFKNLIIDGRIVLKQILKHLGAKVWNVKVS
jgi:hypothetical protein